MQKAVLMVKSDSDTEAIERTKLYFDFLPDINDLVYQKDRIRMLTSVERARLQTIPEWYKWECSATQQCRMLGNGWTVDVIVHILSHMKMNEIE